MNLRDKIEKVRENRWYLSKTGISERKLRLKKLKKAILEHQDEIAEAIKLDFQKNENETFLTEIYPTIHEINFALKNLRKWMSPVRVSTPVTLLGTKSFIIKEAKGLSLIIAPWNYPFYLVMSPFISAIAAGCACVLRPSEKTENTAKVIKKIVELVFLDNEVIVALGDIEVSKELLEISFDHIFYTGSTRVGKIVMEKASKNLTSVTLELGGKSPVIIDKDVDVEDAVSKIAWGKFINAGQTCVAPDYVFIPKNIEESFYKHIKKYVENMYGDTRNDRKKSKDFARIIDEGSFNRLVSFIDPKDSLFDDTISKDDRFYVPPTVLKNISLESPIMKEEIFGPILPVVVYDSIDDVINYISRNDKPLALYIFSKNKKFIRNVLDNTSSGGVGINQVILHLANPHLPFGGIGSSGMGSSHGEFGFNEFTHQRGILKQGALSFFSFYYPPYDGIISKLAFKMLNYLK